MEELNFWLQRQNNNASPSSRTRDGTLIDKVYLNPSKEQKKEMVA